MTDLSPKAIAQARAELGVPVERLPRSVAIIMDGNGRWARRQGLPRVAGHQEGAKNVLRIITEAARLGIEALTLYSFSIENWNRPAAAVNALMHLYAQYLGHERPTLVANNIRLRHLGRRASLPVPVQRELDESVRISSVHTGMYLCLALNYGGRAEITDAVRRLAARAAQGEIDPAAIDEADISAALDSAGIPDPDLLIRTSGEWRLSNFLLWQLSYAEFYVSDLYWPEFGPEAFRQALIAHAGRHRRFGGLEDAPPAAESTR
ncbi:MAG: polyprenyl diphosphate synthase [Planctomycetota bacterium]|nr:polyprenyl diphosphate synthase [Planctomycetota bacterium]